MDLIRRRRRVLKKIPKRYSADRRRRCHQVPLRAERGKWMAVDVFFFFFFSFSLSLKDSGDVRMGISDSPSADW